MSHVLKRGTQDSSSDKGICCQAWVRAQDPKGGKRNISALHNMYPYAGTHICNKKQINKFKK